MSVMASPPRRWALGSQVPRVELAARTALIAVLVSVGYYVGTEIGMHARYPQGGPSILWPPNAILLSVLLLTPVRSWGIYLLAAFPAHVVMEYRAGFPWPLILGLFVTNCGQALIGALAVRRFIGSRLDFGNLRHVAVFIAVAAFVAPFVSSFADVAIWVATAWPADIRYWPAWTLRFASNTLTILVVTPALVLGVTRGSAWWSRPPPLRRWAEAAVLTAGLAAAGIMIGVSEPGRVLALVYTPLPLVLWAAVRFGSLGVSVSLLATTLCMTFGAARHLGSLAGPSESAHDFAIQFFMVMIVTAVSLLFLAAVLRERERAEATLRERLAFEALLSEVSARFARRSSEEIADAVQDGLARIVECLDVDRATLGQLSDDGRTLVIKHALSREGIGRLPAGIQTTEFPWGLERSRRGEAICFSRLNDLPGEAATDRESYRRYGAKSVVVVPLMAGGTGFGILTLATLRHERMWPDEIVERLQLLGEVFTTAVIRQQAEAEARKGEALNRAVLASLAGAVAVVDRAGAIVRVNETWIRVSQAYGGVLLPEFVAGGNYLDACRRGTERGVPDAELALAGIQAVLDRTRPGFSLEYAGPERAPGSWWEMLVVPLGRPEGGAVVTHRDISDRKRGEHEAQRQRESLAHAARVLAVGELAGSLAHELNQPLTAMVTNALAAGRLLHEPTPDLVELRAILSDIVQDGKRGADVIRGVRGLLRRGGSDQVAVDLNPLLREVAGLLGNDAVTKGISVRLEMSPDLPPVLGERVQLQQVILNLFMNAFEAMSGVAAGPRELVVRTRYGPAGVEFLVSDTGPGVSEEALARMFEPFFTTKPEGLGLGLSISRTIVRDHGGEIAVVRHAGPGSTMSVTLPPARIPESEEVGRPPGLIAKPAAPKA
jgi:C4-dicarboxylate-specific signal transduction histidine kinase/integral membrane sensor domain MASE1